VTGIVVGMTIRPKAVKDAIAAFATKREVAAALGVTASHIASLVHSCGDHSLQESWRGLPADGAFAGVSRNMPASWRHQNEADELVAEAIADWPIDVTWNQRECVVGVLLAMFNITGSMAFPRGWVRSVMLAFDAAGHSLPPTPCSLRWYRRKLQHEPEAFAEVYGVNPQLIEDLASGPA
jgi:hypothetical protein